MAKKTTKVFYFGKNIKKTDSAHSPLRGVRNTNIDFYEKATGAFHRRRKIGDTGLATKDYDAPDAHKPHFHVHDFVGVKRLQDRSPSRQEWREIKKAKRKRRVW